MKKNLILIASAVLLFGCQQLPKSSDSPHLGQRVPSSPRGVVLHGLDDVDLKYFSDWTSGLVWGEKTSRLLNEGNINEQIYTAYSSSQSANDFLAKILDLQLAKHFQKSDLYRQLAQGLYSVRKKIRNDLTDRPDYTRKAMQVLEVLAEEALYAQYLAFPNQSVVRFDYAPLNLDQCKDAKGKRSSLLGDFSLCQGDIILSKGGAGSSNFIARLGDYPGNFSHAVVTSVDPTDKKISLAEAEIEDGVRFRDPTADYVQNKKIKMFIYRAKNPATLKAAIAGVDQFVIEAQKRIPGKDIKKEISFDYDFAMNADDDKKLFCSEVVYYAYNFSANSKLDNPYSKKYWSSVQDPLRKNFLESFLSITPRFPAPSDLELNPHFDLIAMQFDLSKFSQDRMRVALIDALYLFMQDHDEIAQGIFKKFAALGNGALKPAEIKAKLAQLQAWGVKLPSGALAKVDSIPQNINFKQLLFFSFLNDHLTPAVIATLEKKEKELMGERKILDFELLRLESYKVTEKMFNDLWSKLKN